MAGKMYRVRGEVYAVKWTGSNAEEIAELLGPVVMSITREKEVKVEKNGQTIWVPEGEWLLRLCDGEYATCDDQDFQEIYEEVADA